MSRTIVSFTFNYEIECTGIEANELSYKLRNRLEQAARHEVDNLKDSEAYIKRLSGGLTASQIDDVSSFADETFAPFEFSPNEALYAGMSQSFATLFRQWNREIRHQVDRPEFQSAKMLLEDSDGFGGKCMPKITSKFARRTVSEAAYEMDYAARRAIMDAFVNRVVLNLEGAYEDGVEPSNTKERYEEDSLF